MRIATLSRSTSRLALVCALAAPLCAQLSEGGRPPSFDEPLPAALPTVSMPWVDAEALRAENARYQPGRPFQWGIEIPVDLSPSNCGAWDVAGDGSLVWRLRLESVGAYSIGLQFDRFALPEGARLFVYDDARERVLGAYTRRNNKARGEFAIQPHPGEALVLEYVQDSSVEEPVELSLSTVIHDCVDVWSVVDTDSGGAPTAADGGAADASCLVDINCPEGADWQDEKRAVARIFMGGGLCSGALLTNTSYDGTQYFLTANHCGDMSNAVFLFNYERSGCDTGTAPTNQTVHGATLLSTDGWTDHRLIRITEGIPASYNVYLAGWQRTGALPISTTSITHPSAGPKKITHDFNYPSKPSPWWVTDWEVGLIEGGSSGGPLFNEHGQVLGACCCVNNFDCATQVTSFGRLELYWNQVKGWLDPLSIAPDYLDGYDPSGPPPPTPSTTFEIVDIQPVSVQALMVDGPATVTLVGGQFTTVQEVRVNGVELMSFPPEFFVTGNHVLELMMPQVDKLGPIDIQLTNAKNTISTQIQVLENAAPTLDVGNSDPALLFTLLPATVRLAGAPGSVCFLWVSTEELPTAVPGLLELGIGNGYTSLFYVAAAVIPAQGWAQLNFPIGGVKPGTRTFWQGSAYETGWPMVPTNIQSTTVIF